jgi:hypothetical protein
MKKEEEEKIDFFIFYLNKTRFLILFAESGLAPPLAPPIDFIIDPSSLLEKFAIRKKRIG